jgi:hypothetical protein
MKHHCSNIFGVYMNSHIVFVDVIDAICIIHIYIPTNDSEQIYISILFVTKHRHYFRFVFIIITFTFIVERTVSLIFCCCCRISYSGIVGGVQVKRIIPIRLLVYIHIYIYIYLYIYIPYHSYSTCSDGNI